MLKEYKKKTNIGVGVGLILYLLSKGMVALGGLAILLAPFVSLAAITFFLWGCSSYAKGKGYHRAVGLLGLLSCIGLLVLAVLPDKSATRRSSQPINSGRGRTDARLECYASRRALTVAAFIILGCVFGEVVRTAIKIAPKLQQEQWAQTIYIKAWELQQARKYAEALSFAKLALKMREDALGKFHPDVAKCLELLGDLHGSEGEHARAEEMYARALAIREVAFGKEHPYVADSLDKLATSYRNQQRYARAEPLYERVLAIREAALHKPPHDAVAMVTRHSILRHENVVAALNHLAALYTDQERYARAAPLYERALALQEADFGPNHPDVADALDNLAALYAEQGQYARAESLYERALAIRDAAPRKDLLRIAESINSLAALYSDQGKYTRAERLYERALATQDQAGGKYGPHLVRLLGGLATLYVNQGQYERAEPLLQHAFEIQDQALGELHPDGARPLNSLARIRLAQRRLPEALLLFARALNASEEHLRQEVLSSSEARLANVLHRLRADEERLYALARAHPHEPLVRRLALTTAILRKGRSVGEIANTSRIIYRSLLDQTEREIFERLRASRTQLATLWLSGPGQLSLEDHQQRLKELADKSKALETELAESSAPLRTLHALPPAAELMDRVAQVLPNDSALVEFVAYNDSILAPNPASAPSGAPGELRYLALVLFADGRTRTLDLGRAEPIDRAALRLHDALSRRVEDHQSVAQQLHALAFRPLVPLLGKVRRLYLSPEGQLALVPFAALHDGNRFLADVFDISYVTSGRDLLPRLGAVVPVNEAVVFADPAFGSTSAAPSPSTQTRPTERSASLERFFATLRADIVDQPWSPLPATRKEAEAIQRLLPQARMYLDRAATKDALLKLETPGLLHIATHGFFLEDAPAPADTRAVKTFGVLGDTGFQQRPPDPLLRSGLVLAGAHAPEAQPGAHRRKDSLVTALELAGLNLWGTQLVVLSACDTGRGDVKLGQGVYGLRRALVVAGAETVVTSLWKVNDETTRELMEGYYGNMLAGQGRAEALRNAMRVLRQKQPHPHFWAPFIVIGQDGPLRGITPYTAERTVP